MSIISIITEKGGVGKTTTAINAGSALVKKGFKVLLIDMDKQRNLTSTANITADGQYREIHRTIVDIFCELIKGRNPTIQNLYIIMTSMVLTTSLLICLWII